MRQYQVPQFIDVEDKIIGPLTLKQFLYLLAGLFIAMIIRTIFIPILAYIIDFFVLAGSAALAFYKPGGVPLPKIIRGALSYFMKPRLYIWKQEEQKKKPSAPHEEDLSKVLKVPDSMESKLEDLAWSLDIKEKIDNRQQ